jgi:type VI secretion system protein VasD
MGISKRFAVPLAAAAVLLAGACAGKPPAPKIGTLAGTIEATAHANPDGRGRPSPVVVKIFELRAHSAFDNADFFSLADRERDALGTDLVRKDEYTLRPGERVALDRTLDAETRYLGLLAGYRDLERSRWRTGIAVAPNDVNRLLVRLDAAGLTLLRD